MERLIGKKVCHKDLGEGVIIKAEDTNNGIIITVEYPGLNKQAKYGFPAVLGKSIASDDELLSIAADIAIAKEETRKKAEVEKMAEEEIKEAEKRQSLIRTYEDIDKNTDWDKQFDSENFQIFKVHQGQTFQEEYRGRFVWAPASGIHHHEKMTDIHKGDIIFHYANGNLVAIGEAVSDCFHCLQPASITGHGWGRLGYCVRVRYQLLTAPFSLAPFRASIINNRAGRHSSFDRNGDACQGYMYDLELDLARLFKTGILATFQPAGVIAVLNRIR